MDGERKIHISEGVPLNSTGAANIFLNTGKSTAKLNSPDGTVIHLKTGEFLGNEIFTYKIHVHFPNLK